MNATPPNQRLYLLFTPTLCRGDALTTLRQAIAGGVDLVQWRVKPPDADRNALCRCHELCTDLGVPLMINDSAALAVEIDARGAHIGQDDGDSASARAALGRQRWLGISTHDLDQIRSAERAGADYLGFGPCFPTDTKSYENGQSTEAIAAAVAATALPVFAIGGIDAERANLLSELGVRRIAVSSAILAARDPQQAAAELRAALA